jgi:LacI family transcriptional regulator
MKRKTNPTLKQIAELSGFSQASVSMILNQKNGAPFSQETIRLVLEAADTLGYSKSLVASPMSQLSGRNIIAVLCPNISNPYYSTLVQAIEQAAFQKNFQIVTLNTYRSPEIEARNLAVLQDSQIAGIIFAMPSQAPQALEKVSKRIPVVLIGDKGSVLNIDTVEMDNYGAGVLIAKHLIELGHKHIAYISTTLDAANNMRIRRLKGVEDTFAAECPGSSVRVISRGIVPAEELNDLFIEHHLGYEFAKEGMKDKRITAFVGVNDMVAYGIIDAITTEKFQIPSDYSVCGFDNIFPSRLCPISLTTVDNFIVEKGHNAFSILHSRMSGTAAAHLAPHTITRVEYSPRLIVRGSTSQARASR